MALSTYAELLTELDAWLNRSDLTARIPALVRLLESRVNRILRVPEMEAETTFTLASGVDTYALPDDFLAARSVIYDDEELLGVTPATLRSNYDTAEGIPIAYAIVGTDMVMAPTPNAADTATLNYFQSIPALTADNTSNWLLTKYPDLYLWGSLTMAEAYLRDDERVAVWKSAWDEALAEIVRAGNKQRLPANPLAARPVTPE